MKTNELKELVKQCDSKKIEKIVSSIYRKVPKGKKDELDEEIFSIVNDSVIKKVVKEKSDFNSLKEEVETFLFNAYERNYFIPNRIITKKNRSNWRFKVINFIKSLQNIEADDENYDEANYLLLGLFDVLSYACAFYTFITRDPFSSAGIRQCDFYKLLVKRFFKKEKNDETITKLIERATSCFLDDDALHIFMIYILIGAMQNEKELLYLKNLTKEIFQKGGFDISKYKTSSEHYYKSESDNNLLLLVYCISLELNDPFSEIDFFMDNYKNSDLEIGLYVLLNSINYDESDEDWIKVYDYITNKYEIDVRDSLKEEYIERKRNIK